MQESAQKHDDTAVAALCRDCGLCCNGVLFGSVKLQAKEDGGRLAALGLIVEGRGRGQFAQPCSCFDGKLCRIYEDRPAMCRTFECGLLKRVHSNAITIPAAKRAIREARQHVRGVMGVLGDLGNRDEHWPLSRRCAQVIAEPLDLTADQRRLKLRARLMRVLQKLTESIARDFLK
jgi:Fe-S-cluster containining protein